MLFFVLNAQLCNWLWMQKRIYMFYWLSVLSMFTAFDTAVTFIGWSSLLIELSHGWTDIILSKLFSSFRFCISRNVLTYMLNHLVKISGLSSPWRRHIKFYKTIFALQKNWVQLEKQSQDNHCEAGAPLLYDLPIHNWFTASNKPLNFVTAKPYHWVVYGFNKLNCVDLLKIFNLRTWMFWCCCHHLLRRNGIYVNRNIVNT